MALQDDDPEPPEPASLGRWAVALGLAGLALVASWLLKEPEPPLESPRSTANAPISPSGSPAGSPSGQPPAASATSGSAQPGAGPETPASGRSQTASLPATSPEVIHKHALGSCRGHLVVTAAELRYEAAKPSDRFSIPLGALETFALDRPRNSLRVKARTGRTWNFTSDSASADALETFARHVETARRAVQSRH